MEGEGTRDRKERERNGRMRETESHYSLLFTRNSVELCRTRHGTLVFRGRACTRVGTAKGARRRERRGVSEKCSALRGENTANMILRAAAAPFFDPRIATAAVL